MAKYQSNIVNESNLISYVKQISRAVNWLNHLEAGPTLQV